MKGLTIALVAWVAWTSILIPSVLGDSVDFFPLAIGNSWTYKATVSGFGTTVEGDLKTQVTSQRTIGGSNCYVLQFSLQGKVTNEQCLGWEGQRLLIYQKVENGVDLGLSSPQVELETPLAVGRTWSWTGSLLNPEISERFTGKLRWEVARQSNVTVPAGTYDAYVVQIQLDIGETYSLPAISGMQHLWFVEGVGLVKEVDSLYSTGQLVTMTADLSSYHLTPSVNQIMYGVGVLVAGAVVSLVVIVLLRRRSSANRMATDWEGQSGEGELPTREPIEQEPVSAQRNLGTSKKLSRDGASPVRDVSGDSDGHFDDILYEDKFAKKKRSPRGKIGALASMLMLWVGWGIITFTTYEYFPSTMSPTSPVGLLFAIITVSVTFPLTRRAWRVFKES